jgi:hypothetical protein
MPKIKDLVNAPTHKYENIYNSMNQPFSLNTSNINDLPNPTTTMSNKDYDNLLPNSMTSTSIPKPEVNTMKNELKNFLKKQLKGSGNVGRGGEGGGGGGGDIPSTMDYGSNAVQYSTY